MSSNFRKNLSSLLGSKEKAKIKEEIQYIDIDLLTPSRYQPRKVFDEQSIDELAESIKGSGVLQPIIVSKRAGGEFYEIIAGERRWRACSKAGQKQIKAIVRDCSEGELLEIALIENIQREDLRPIAEARGFLRLADEFGYTQEDIATRAGKSRSHVANLMRLIQLPKEVQEMIEAGKLSAGHAKCLIGAKDALLLANKIVSQGLNVRQTEEMIKRLAGKANEAPPAPIKENASENDKERLTEILSNIIDAKIKLDIQPKKGKIVIEYRDMEHLDSIVAKLSRIRSYEDIS